MTNDDMLRKIQGLIAKAEKTDNEHERDAFYAKAQAMMLKHAIDEAMLEASGKPTEDGLPVTEKFQYSTDDRFRPGKVSLLTGIAKTNRCRVVYHTGSKKAQHATLVGFKSDIDFVKLLYTSALMQAMSGASKAYKANPVGTRHRYLSNFIVGFAQTVTERLRDAEREARADAGATVGSGTSTALALVDRSKQVEAKLSETFPRLGTMRSSMTYNGSARGAGAQAGKRADLSGGRNTVGGTRKQIK